jgi:WD40 repeat protein
VVSRSERQEAAQDRDDLLIGADRHPARLFVRRVAAPVGVRELLAVFSEASTGNPIKLIDSTSGDILSTVQEKILFFLDETKQVRHLYQPEIDVDKLGVWQDENLICTMDIQHYQTIDPTHSYLVTLSNWHFDIWDIDQCTISAQVNNDFNPIYMASYTDRAFSSDGSYLALFSPFSHENLRVWDFSLDNAFEIQKPLPEEISSLPDRASIAFIPNTDILVINTDKGTTFFDVQKWELVETEANLSQLNFLHWTDIISVDGELLIRLLPNKDRVLFLKAENDAYLGELEPPFQFTDIVFSPDGRLLVFISGDGTLHVWGVKKDEVSTN